MIFYFNPFEGLLNQLINIIPLIFVILKYILVIILFVLGFRTFIFIKKGQFYENITFKNTFISIRLLIKLRLLLGIFFIFSGLGILFNYLTLFLIWIFQDFQGILIFILKEVFIKILSYNIDQINNLFELINPLIGLGSFYGLIQFIIIFYFLLNNYNKKNVHKEIYFLFLSILVILLFGFKCLPYFL